MKQQWRNLLAFAQQSDTYLATNKGETKLEYAIKRVRSQITKHSEKLQEMMADIEIDLCVTDDKDVIQRDVQGNLRFTRENFKERNKRQRALLDEEFEIEPFFVSKMPENLTPEQLMAFTGLILLEDQPMPFEPNVESQVTA